MATHAPLPRTPLGKVLRIFGCSTQATAADSSVFADKDLFDLIGFNPMDSTPPVDTFTSQLDTIRIMLHPDMQRGIAQRTQKGVILPTLRNPYESCLANAFWDLWTSIPIEHQQNVLNNWFDLARHDQDLSYQSTWNPAHYIRGAPITSGAWLCPIPGANPIHGQIPRHHSNQQQPAAVDPQAEKRARDKESAIRQHLKNLERKGQLGGFRWDKETLQNDFGVDILVNEYFLRQLNAFSQNFQSDDRDDFTRLIGDARKLRLARLIDTDNGSAWKNLKIYPYEATDVTQASKNLRSRPRAERARGKNAFGGSPSTDHCERKKATEFIDLCSSESNPDMSIPVRSSRKRREVDGKYNDVVTKGKRMRADDSTPVNRTSEVTEKASRDRSSARSKPTPINQIGREDSTTNPCSMPAPAQLIRFLELCAPGLRVVFEKQGPGQDCVGQGSANNDWVATFSLGAKAATSADVQDASICSRHWQCTLRHPNSSRTHDRTVHCPGVDHRTAECALMVSAELLQALAMRDEASPQWNVKLWHHVWSLILIDPSQASVMPAYDLPDIDPIMQIWAQACKIIVERDCMSSQDTGEFDRARKLAQDSDTLEHAQTQHDATRIELERLTRLLNCLCMRSVSRSSLIRKQKESLQAVRQCYQVLWPIMQERFPHRQNSDADIPETAVLSHIHDFLQASHSIYQTAAPTESSHLQTMELDGSATIPWKRLLHSLDTDEHAALRSVDALNRVAKSVDVLKQRVEREIDIFHQKWRDLQVAYKAQLEREQAALLRWLRQVDRDHEQANAEIARLDQTKRGQ